MISRKSLDEYKQIWKEQYNEEISDDEALESAIKLLTLIKAIYKPITQQELDVTEKRRRETGDYEKD